MKIDKRKKTERNEIVKEYASQHPDKSLAEIAVIFGVTRQRISIIVGSRPRERENEEVA